MNITYVDLNVLLAFEALREERSVTRATVRIGLTQPAGLRP
jgi:DNA-binding transcriptional LysR family regulator